MKITDIITEAASPAQQAAIAISMKTAGKKPKTVDEDLTRRGFLRGLGAAVAGAAGSALAGSGDPGFIRQVQDQHYSMIEKNPRYAKEHQALQLPVARGIAGSSAETNKRWAEKTAELLEKYGVKVNEGVAEGHPSDNDMGATTGGTKMTLNQWKQMWMKKMPNADFAALFRSPPNMQGSAIAYFDGWENTPAARWDPQKGVTENNQRGDSLVTDALKIMRGAEVGDAVKALKTVLGDREYNSRRGFYNFYIRQMIDMYGQQGVAEADMNRRGFLKGIGAAMAGAAGIGAASNSQARASAKWLETVEQAKELLAKGFTPDQIAKKLGVTGPNNGMAGPMNGDWGAINYAVQQVQQVKRTGMQEGSKSSNKNKKA